MTIGEKLKKAREERGLTYKEIQNTIKIRTKYLEALEKNEYDVIPGEAYIRAFLKSYGNHIGLNGEELVEEYNRLKEEERRLLEESEEETGKTGYEFLQNKTLISIIIALVIVLILAILIYNVGLLNNSMTELKVSQQIENNKQNNSLIDQYNFPEEQEINGDDNLEEVSLEDMITKVSPEQEEIETQDSLKELEIIITERSWLQIYADGEKLYEGILDEGDNKNVAYKDNISMKIGNAVGVQVKKDNEIYGPWGARGEVIEKIIE